MGKQSEIVEEEIKSESPVGLLHMDSLKVNRNQSHFVENGVDSNPGYEVDEEEYDALPLTFNCREDLNKKLANKKLMTIPLNSNKCRKRKREGESPETRETKDIETKVKVKKEPVFVGESKSKLLESNSISSPRDETPSSQSAPDVLTPSPSQMMPPDAGVRVISMVKLLN